MDSGNTRSRGSYRYVPRRGFKSDDSDNKGQQHRNDNNTGHHHHDNKQHQHHGSKEKQGNFSLSNYFIDKSIDSVHNHRSTGNTHEHGHSGHGAHHHTEPSSDHKHSMEHKFEHINQEFLLNLTTHDTMNSSINSVYNSTNSMIGALNSTMPIIHHSGHHDDNHLLQHDLGHSDMIHPKVDQSEMGGMEGHMGGMGGHMGGMGGHMGGMAGMGDMEGHHHGMGMYFSLKTDSHFLLEGLKISSIEGILTAMVFTILMTIIVECLAHSIQYRQLRRIQLKGTLFQRVVFHFATSLLHMLSLCSAYVGMLCVMTMNIWLLVAVIIGSGVGHLLIKPLLRSCCTAVHDDHVSDTKKLDIGDVSVNALLNTDENSSESDHKRYGQSGHETDVLMCR